MYEATGKIKVIFDTQTFPSGFTKREFVIITGDQYPQDIKFELVKDKCSLLDNFSQDQEVTVSFDIRGNEYKEKYYVNLSCWKIIGTGQGNGGGGVPSSQAPANTPAAQPTTFGEPSSDDLRSDDIPF